MNDRQRYAVGIAAAVLVHLFAVVMLGLFGVKYMEVPLRGEVLQVSIDTGGNRGGGGSKGKKAPNSPSRKSTNTIRQNFSFFLFIPLFSPYFPNFFKTFRFRRCHTGFSPYEATTFYHKTKVSANDLYKSTKKGSRAAQSSTVRPPSSFIYRFAIKLI